MKYIYTFLGGIYIYEPNGTNLIKLVCQSDWRDRVKRVHYPNNYYSRIRQKEVSYIVLKFPTLPMCKVYGFINKIQILWSFVAFLFLRNFEINPGTAEGFCFPFFFFFLFSFLLPVALLLLLLLLFIINDLAISWSARVAKS